MDDQLMDRYLRSVGKQCFVTYFYQFRNLSQSTTDIAGLIFRENAYTIDSCRTRASKARRIIEAGLAKDALINIANSKKVAQQLRDAASLIAEQRGATRSVYISAN